MLDPANHNGVVCTTSGADKARPDTSWYQGYSDYLDRNVRMVEHQSGVVCVACMVPDSNCEEAQAERIARKVAEMSSGEAADMFPTDEIDVRALNAASIRYRVPTTSAACREFLRSTDTYQRARLHLALVALGAEIVRVLRIPQLADWLARRLAR